MTGQVRVFAVITAKEGHSGDLAELLKGMTGPSRAEPGNLRYNLWQDKEAESRFVLEELYRDEPSAAEHQTTPHFQHYLSLVNDFAERIVTKVRPVDVVE